MKLASAALAIFAILPSTNAGLRGITNEKDDLHAQPNVFSSKNNGNGNGNNESNIGNRPGKPDTVPTEQGNNGKPNHPNGPNGNAFGHSATKGQIILGGGKGQGKGLGAIDNSSVLAAQEGGKRVLGPYLTKPPTPSPTFDKYDFCDDTPDWEDSFGDGCIWYETHDTLGCFTYGDDYAGSMGVARDNCCFCVRYR